MVNLIYYFLFGPQQCQLTPKQLHVHVFPLHQKILLQKHDRQTGKSTRHSNVKYRRIIHREGQIKTLQVV